MSTVLTADPRRSPPEKRHSIATADQAVAQVEAAIGAGYDVKAACRLAGVSVPSYYRWRARRDGVSTRPEQVRTAILDAAKRLFLAEGYGASLDAVATAASVARQTVYNQFGSKERLFGEVVQSVYQRLAGPVLLIQREEGLVATLTSLGRHFMKMAFDPESLALQRIALGEYRNAPELAKVAYALRAMHAIPVLTDFIADYLRQQMELGIIEPADERLAAEAFSGSFTAHARHRILVGVGGITPEWQETMLAFCVKIFARGLGYKGTL
jgi:TetR/AcrR family transcriptional repressor of mexJK operon